MLLLFACVLSAPARAQLYSYADWTEGTSLVVLRVALPDAAATVLAGPGIPALTDTALSAYVAAHVGVHADGRICPPMDQGEDVGLIDTLARTPGLHRYEVMFLCPTALAGAALSLEDRILFDRVPGHIGLARVVLADGHTVLRRTDAAHQVILVPATGIVAGTGILGYAGIGWQQLFGNASRLACFAALLLAARRRQDALAAGAGLVAGLVLALAIGTSGAWALRPDAAGTVIGLLTMLLAWRAIAGRSLLKKSGGFTPAPRLGAAPPAGVWGGTPALPSTAIALAGAILLLAAREAAIGHIDDCLLLLAEACLAPAVLLLRTGAAAPLGLIVPASLFGLLNGAGFAAAIAGVGLPAAASALPLAGHALGALAACAVVAALACGGVRLARPFVFGRALAFDLAAAALIGAGMFWFASRLHA